MFQPKCLTSLLLFTMALTSMIFMVPMITEPVQTSPLLISSSNDHEQKIYTNKCCDEYLCKIDEYECGYLWRTWIGHIEITSDVKKSIMNSCVRYVFVDMFSHIEVMLTCPLENIQQLYV